MIGDDLAAVLPELRAEAESRMRDTVTVRAVAGTEPDPLTGDDVVTYADEPVYQGKCRVRIDSYAQPTTADSAGSTVTSQSRQLHVPWDAPEILDGHVAFLADDTFTPRLRGVVYRVTGAHEASDTTAQRVPVTRLGVPNG